MKTKKIFALPALAFAAAMFTVGAQAQYTAVDLHPAGADESALDGISADGTQQVGYSFVGTFLDGENTSLIYNGPSGTNVDISPLSGFDNELGVYPIDTDDGDVQVGWGFLTGTFSSHAVIWQGSAATAVDIDTGGFDNSEAVAIDGNKILGNEFTDAMSAFATVWTFPALTSTQLGATGFLTTTGLDTENGLFVGYGSTDTPTIEIHALLWTSESSASVVDLHPASGYDSSRAEATDGINQYGRAVPTGFSGVTRAVKWTGSAASMTELHPASGYESSSIVAAANGVQVGSARLTGGATHAAMWNETAGSFVDLHSVLDGGVYLESEATDVSDNGIVVGFAIDSMSGLAHAMMWLPPGAAVNDWNLY